MTIDAARKLMEAAGVFFGDFDEDEPDTSQMLNLNDVFGWALADAEDVSDEDLPELASMFFRYGWCGILAWVSGRRDGMRSEFEDNNRFIDFVLAEEMIVQEVPNSSQRAYAKRRYTLGDGPLKIEEV